MRDFIERYQIPIGLVLIAAILVGAGLLWRKDQQAKKSEVVSADTTKLDALESENLQLKAKLANPSTQTVSAETATDKININTADAKALDSLPGIGPTYAQRIIDYRTQNGNFSSIDELTKVKGIGTKTLDKFKDLITL